MALTGMAIAAALALAKNEFIDQPAAKKQRQLAAATAAYSPWTGMTPQNVQNPNVANSLLQYGSAGAAIGSGVQKSQMADDDPSYWTKALYASSPTAAPSVGTGGPDYSTMLGNQANGFNAYMGAYNPWLAQR